MSKDGIILIDSACAEFLEFLEQVTDDKISKQTKEKMRNVITKEKIMKMITEGPSSQDILNDPHEGPKGSTGATGPCR